MAENGDKAKTCAQVVDDGDFFVVFQPLIDIRSTPMSVFAYETLVRSKSPQFPSPPAFINAAIEEGVVGKLGRAIREQAIKGHRGWDNPTHYREIMEMMRKHATVSAGQEVDAANLAMFLWYLRQLDDVE